MRITLKIGAILLLVFGFGVGLTAFLSQTKFERTLEDLVQSRLDVVAADLRNTVEAALSLGLSLEEAEDIPNALRAAVAADPEIRAITIETPDGDAVYAVGAQPENGASLKVSTPVNNAFGKSAGTLTVYSSRAAVDRVADRVLDRHIALSASAVALAALLGTFLAWLSLRRLIVLFRDVRDALDAMLRGRTAPVETPPADAPELIRDFAAFRHHTREAFVALHEAERSVEKPDGEA